MPVSTLPSMRPTGLPGAGRGRRAARCVPMRVWRARRPSMAHNGHGRNAGEGTMTTCGPSLGEARDLERTRIHALTLPSLVQIRLDGHHPRRAIVHYCGSDRRARTPGAGHAVTRTYSPGGSLPKGDDTPFHQLAHHAHRVR